MASSPPLKREPGKGQSSRPYSLMWPGACSGAKVLWCRNHHEWMGIHVLTLASAVVKPAADGQLPEDSATCARDADPQEAGVLETTRRGSQLVAKTRRDQSRTHRE